MKIIIIVILIFVQSAIDCLSQSDKELAKQYGMQALELMDKDGKFYEAIALLEKSKELDPDNIAYPYEIAYAKYHLKYYSECINILERLTTHKDVSFRIFQLLGNSYDMNGEPDESIASFKRGLVKFPNSGSLYLGCGIVENGRENYIEAIKYWEKGVEVEPMFASNYFWLAYTMTKTNEPVWSIFYGEIFMNLERNSERTEKMSELLYENYKDLIDFQSDTAAVMKIQTVLTMTDLMAKKVPFTLDYKIGMDIALNICIKEYGNEFSIKFLNELRSIFLELWAQKEKDKDVPNVLFDYQMKIRDAGLFEEYNYWLFMQGNIMEFDSWNESKPGKFEKFAEWFIPNQIKLNRQNYFSRTKY